MYLQQLSRGSVPCIKNTVPPLSSHNSGNLSDRISGIRSYWVLVGSPAIQALGSDISSGSLSRLPREKILLLARFFDESRFVCPTGDAGRVSGTCGVLNDIRLADLLKSSILPALLLLLGRQPADGDDDLDIASSTNKG